MSVEDSLLEKLALLELVEDRRSSVRLRNSLRAAYESGDCPYETVGDYIISNHKLL